MLKVIIIHLFPIKRENKFLYPPRRKMVISHIMKLHPDRITVNKLQTPTERETKS